MTRLLSIPAVAFALSTASPAYAHLDEPVRAMIDAAIATGDAKKVAVVIEIARQTNPAHVAEIDALYAAFKDDQAREQRLAEKRRESEIRQAGLFDRWSGEGQIGGSHSSGNSDTLGFNAAVALKREGIDWSHRLRATTDFQRSGGTTRREQYLIAYEPRYQINDRLFGYGLTQWERDPVQGFSARYAVSGGVGYQVFDGSTLDLSVKAGPALRRTALIDGGTDTRLAALFGLDFDWEILDGLKLTQDTNMVAETGGSGTVLVDSRNTTLSLLTGLQARVNERISTRLSYEIEYDSNPPPSAVSTDTTSRFSLVYGF